MDRWVPDFDFYMAQIEDKPASFVVDLNAAREAPVAGYELLLSIRVPMLRPRPDGLRDASELDDLGAVEDQFVEALAEKVDAIYVGRTVHDGETTLYMYVPEAHRAALDDLPALTGAPPGDYRPAWGVIDDPAWQQYLGFLSPGEYALQSIWNRRLVKQFAELNDQLDVAREVDHLAYFPDREAAEQAATALAAAGFRVDEPTAREDEEDAEGDEDAEGEDGDEGDEAEAEGDEGEGDEVEAEGDGDEREADEAEAVEADDDAGEDEEEEDADEDDEADDDGVEDGDRWALQFHRTDALADGRPDEFTDEILDVILPLGGSYDGWGAEHRKAE